MVVHMGKTKLVACRFDVPLYNKINNHVIQNSDLIRKAVIQFLNSDTQEFYTFIILIISLFVSYKMGKKLINIYNNG